jgi:TonB-dependent receptor
VKLQPFRADTYDLSFEWYFAPESLISVALFRKDIDTYIQIIRQDLEYQQLTALNPSAFAPNFCNAPCSPTTIFQLTSAVNTDGGPLEGFEVSFQAPFTFLPAPFNNFGTQLNYTYVSSDIDYCSNATCSAFVTDELVNLSPEAFNATLYWENDVFSARVSASYRDRYLQNVPGRNNNAVEGKKKTFNIDASASYDLNDQVTLTFEALNLTDEENHQYVGDNDRQSTSVFHHTGRQFYVGARYRFR